MTVQDKFIETIRTGYTFKNDAILLGAAMLKHEAIENLQVSAPLKTINRHGLIAGATGTGKTKTLQNLAEGLSDMGVPVMIMDVKGDISGLSQPGNPHPKIDERHAKIGHPWQARSYPVELLSISNEPGVKLRATVSEFGPVLFSKILELNDTQAGIVSIIFKYCDDQKLPLLDLKDFRKTLQYLTNEGRDAIEKEYGLISPSSTGAIMRKIIEIEEQGADMFFGERSFDVKDLLRMNELGQGYINILQLMDIQDKPKLFSTFMLCLLAEIYETFPERGDKDTPELVLFIDEAHLIFKEASKALLEQIETIVKLIRSKGVGLYFCTQSPVDIPAAVLSQLGMKIQHSLRAFTAKDRKAIKLVAENYPVSDFYETDELITSMGIGEAMITVLNEKGIPTPLAHVLLKAPYSRMDIINENERDAILRKSSLIHKYADMTDRESAYEILNKKLEASAQMQAKEARGTAKPAPSVLETASKNTMVRQLGNTIVRELARGLFGILKGK